RHRRHFPADSAGVGSRHRPVPAQQPIENLPLHPRHIHTYNQETNMLKKVLLGAGLIAATAFSSLSSAQTVLRFSNWLPPTHPITTQILQPWAANIENATEGRVKVQFLPALGRPPAHFDLVRNGVADMALSVQAYTADRFPSAYGMTLPGYADDATSAAVAYWRTHQKYF